MCLGIPARIVRIEKHLGEVEIGGVRQKANFYLIEKPQIGDYVILHAGFAIQKLDKKEAYETLKLISEIQKL